MTLDIVVFAKTFEDSRQVHVNAADTVGKIKTIIADAFGRKSTQKISLYIDGKELKDHEVLMRETLRDKVSVHVLFEEDLQETNEASKDACKALKTLIQCSAHEPTWTGMQGAMQQAFLDNPNIVCHILQHPFVQTLMKSPSSLMKITDNLLPEENPLWKHFSNNPLLFRSSFTLSKDSNMLKEVQENYASAYQKATEAFMQSASSEGQAEGERHQESLDSPVSVLRQFTPLPKDADAPEAKKPRVGEAPVVDTAICQQFQAHAEAIKKAAQTPYSHLILEAVNSDHELAKELNRGNPLLLREKQTGPPLVDVADQLLQNSAVVKKMEEILGDVRTLSNNPAEWLPSLARAHGVNPEKEEWKAAVDFHEHFLEGKHKKEVAPDEAQVGAGLLTSQVDSVNRLAGLPVLFSKETLSHIRKPPAQRYAQDVEELTKFGFTDRIANLEALTAAFGDVKEAVRRLQKA